MDILDLTQYFDYVFIVLLLLIAVAIITLRDLFAVVMLTGVYSLLCAIWFVSLDAVDVAFTEAAVGAGISTVLMLGAVLLTAKKTHKVSLGRHLSALFVTVSSAGALLYALADMPVYGDRLSPANSGVGMDYISMTASDIIIPNVVTAVLASYRGFDTMGEVFVVFAAGLGVALIIGLGSNNINKGE